MTSSQTKILSFINISCFSDDLRLIILDYIYFRCVTKIPDFPEYYFRLNIVLENDKPQMQITVSNNTCCYVVSSFGLYCQEKAFIEYNRLINDISSIDFDQIFINVNKEVDHNIYCRYAYCPTDGSTIMIRMKFERGDSELRLYFMDTHKTIRIGDCLQTSITWKSHVEIIPYYVGQSEKLKKKIVPYQLLASQHGKQWKNYATTQMYKSREEILSESFWIGCTACPHKN